MTESQLLTEAEIDKLWRDCAWGVSAMMCSVGIIPNVPHPIAKAAMIFGILGRLSEQDLIDRESAGGLQSAVRQVTREAAEGIINDLWDQAVAVALENGAKMEEGGT